jgi:hypothetical protein
VPTSIFQQLICSLLQIFSVANVSIIGGGTFTAKQQKVQLSKNHPSSNKAVVLSISKLSTPLIQTLKRKTPACRFTDHSGCVARYSAVLLLLRHKLDGHPRTPAVIGLITFPS